jgi:hypothetical protein
MEKSQYSGLYVKPHVIDLVKRRFPGAEKERVHRRVQWNSLGRCEDSPLWLEVLRYEYYIDSLDQDKIDALNAEKTEQEDIYFNRPDTIADYIYWSQCAYWTLDEAVALSLGRDPKLISTNNVIPHSSGGSPFAQEYLRRTDLVRRAQEARQLLLRTPPNLFLTWAKLRELEYPKELEEEVAARGNTVDDMRKMLEDRKAIIDQLMDENNQLVQQRDALLGQSRDREGEKPLHTKEKQSLLKLVYGMASGGYKYNDDEAEAVKDICSDLDESGVSLDPYTVRKYLRAGAELRSRDVE